MTPLLDAVATGIECLSHRTLGDAFTVANVEAVVAFAVIHRVVTLSVGFALRLYRTHKVGAAPIVDTVATGIQFLARSAHGNALPILVSVSRLTRFTRLSVNKRNFLRRAGAVTLAGRASRVRNQISRTLEAGGKTLPMVVVESILAWFTHVAADRNLLGRASTVGLAGGTGLE